MRIPSAWLLLLVLAPSSCDDDVDAATTGTTTTSTETSSPPPTTTPPETSAATPGASSSPGTTTTSSDPSDPDSGESSGSPGTDTDTDTDGDDPGPMVDDSDPQRYEFEFRPDEADPEADSHLETQLAYLDTRVPGRGRLVVYLHGAGAPNTCGSRDHGRMLAGQGFHVVSPCYISDYGVGNCGDDIGGCRLEAFEGVDHSPIIDVSPPNSTERRIVRALEHLQQMHPGGDWQYYLDGDAPRWDRIIISGISHGASSSGVIGMNRVVDRVVMLSGPLDGGQAWLQGDPMTPIDRFWGFTHTGDNQHEGHRQAFEDLSLLGDPVVIDDMDPPYGGSHRLVSSAPTDNGHGSTQAGNASPRDGDAWVFQPAWDLMYTAE